MTANAAAVMRVRAPGRGWLFFFIFIFRSIGGVSIFEGVTVFDDTCRFGVLLFGRLFLQTGYPLDIRHCAKEKLKFH
ncbi:hypothetical protein BZA05DRAFT_389077 [Tricharina praecox]|uniref:uncharacterized protein n=1 Tax=Tricharina praecox TaxID=43433 RepID=UPI00221ED11C|nr:uncharacterized protein BZA05DRAFT_389077 [Tricharina praecox]KAI5856595.1 hypothetical protein BZA05DRAFT_389077 [Tricharina praecox]